MTKKIVSVVAASAIAASSAMAAGQHLIYPAFFAGSGWETTIKVVNKNDSNATVVKAVIYDGKDSHEIKDFNIYLSKNDVSEFKISEANGVITVSGTDGSLPTIVNGVESMASTTTPMSTTFSSADANFGYIVLYTMATVDNGYHSQHDALRQDYATVAKIPRNITTTPIFSNGVIANHANDQVQTNQVVTVGSTGKLPSTYAKSNTGSFTFGLNAGSEHDNLFGYARITDTVNGKDMIVDPTTISGFSKLPIFWLEGEAATALQAGLSNIVTYSATTVNNTDVNWTGSLTDTNASSAYNALDVGLADVKGFYATYGESSNFANSQVLITQPLKRHLIDINGSINATTATTASALTVVNNGKDYYSGVTYTEAAAAANKAATITNYLGCMRAQLVIYDNNEKPATASQFSPAQTPVLTMCNELASTETVPSGNTMSQFLTQSGFTAGYVDANFLTGANASGQSYNAIITQMLATTPKTGTVVTNWFAPETK